MDAFNSNIVYTGVGITKHQPSLISIPVFIKYFKAQTKRIVILSNESNVQCVMHNVLFVVCFLDIQ
jgi:hypothetical protein